MKLRFVLLVAALLAWTVVQGRPKPGTNKHNQDLDGIGSDLDDFLRHRDENNNRQRESNTVYSSRNLGYGGYGNSRGNGYGNYGYQNRYNLNRSPPSSTSGKSKSISSRITNFFKKIIS